MIAKGNPSLIAVSSDASSWQAQLRDAISDPAQLAEFLGLPNSWLQRMQAADERWALRVPVSYASRMRRGDANDPLLLQVMPQLAELDQLPGYVDEPLQESGFSPTEGIVHKYEGRLLLMLTGSCAVHCRYCFRREFDYSHHRLNKAEWQQSLDYIRSRTEVKEVIFSGGDPLVLTDSSLQWFCEQLNDIPHVRTVRVHSRMPIVLPARITDTLIQSFTRNRFKTVFVVHSNHGNEIDPEVAEALQRCKAAGISLLNQSVLLAGINDSATTLADLSERLFDCGVLPYYLHLLDKVAGAAHFDLPEPQGLAIHREMSHRLPGYLVPRLVREVPGMQAKQAAR